MRHAGLCLFGAGGTLGGVKKVSCSAIIPYKNWALSASTRSLLSAVHHPLVTEYFIRLDKKRVELESIQDNSDVVDVPTQGRKPADQSFNFVEWNIRYGSELEVAEKMSMHLSKINKNVALRDQLATRRNLPTDDRDLLVLVEEEIQEILDQIRRMDNEVNNIMMRRLDSSDTLGSCSRTWTLEVAGKAGGEEASLFAVDLAEMYKVYASEVRKWDIAAVDSPLDGDLSDSCPAIPKNSNAKLQIKGEGVYRQLRHEIGVHKVQRVPVTDQDGKMQTSTAVVTLMPVLDPVSVNIHESDCAIEFVRGSGPGGQGMQSSSNAVCLTHKPSGISVKCHQSRSALGNKELALQMVAQQLLSRLVKSQNSSIHEAWCNQWSSGERSDRLRTYNYPQNRVTDHRLGKDFPLGTFMERGAGLKTLHDDLNAVDDEQQLVTVLLRHIEGDFNPSI
ncbi:PCRF domain [Trypanosoma vivax]|nr:PCRF domain [Trypanosoma vivax]